MKKQPLSAPDKSHLHHCLLRLGYSHRETVLIIYGMSAVFGLLAIILSQAAVWVSMIILVVVLLALEIIAEKIGLVDANYRPILKIMRVIRYANGKQN